MKHLRPYVRHGLTRIDLVVILLAAGAIGAASIDFVAVARERSNRVKCASNLRMIGQAMMLYANDNKGQYPRTRYDPADGAKLNFYTGSNSPNPFAADGPAANDVTAALFLMIRNADLNPEVFLCPTQHREVPSDLDAERSLEEQIAGMQQALNRLRAQRGATQLPVLRVSAPPASQPANAPAKAPKAGWEVMEMSNFPGPDDLSYSITNPYPSKSAVERGYKYNNGQIADFAIAADLNPGGVGLLQLTAKSPATAIRKGNSANHNGDGQNVLYNDGHVEWCTSPFAGANRDNIYTRAKARVTPGEPDQAANAASEPGSDPALALDSVLLPIADQRPTTPEPAKR